MFSNFGLKVLFAGGGTGHGIVVDQVSKKETFMKMVEIQAGLGMGIKIGADAPDDALAIRADARGRRPGRH